MLLEMITKVLHRFIIYLKHVESNFCIMRLISRIVIATAHNLRKQKLEQIYWTCIV